MLSINVSKRLRDITVAVNTVFPVGTSVLLGPSGHGKTTILNMIAGIMQPDSGSIAINGQALFDTAQHVNVAIERRNVGFVFQDFALFPHLSAFENIAYGLRARHLPSLIVRERVERQMERFQISKLRDALPARISAGQRQRVALARTLVLEPCVLLLDEPLSALDPQLRIEVRCELAQIFGRLGVPILLVTHDHLDARDLADRIFVIEHGSISESGALAPPEDGRPAWAQPDDSFDPAAFANGRHRPINTPVQPELHAH